VRVDPPNPLSVWSAVLHDLANDEIGSFGFKILAVGPTREVALDRLEALLREIATHV
jgi:hypothetical protein